MNRSRLFSVLRRKWIGAGVALTIIVVLLALDSEHSASAYRSQSGTFVAAQASTAQPEIMPGTHRTDSAGIAQVYVPAACFLMGSNPAADPQTTSIEVPEHTACITQGYWLDQFDVTNAAFDAFMQAGGYVNDGYWSTEGLQWKMQYNIQSPDTTCAMYSSAPQQPHICVNYYEAQAYANWRGGELPTEAEWELAARSMDQRVYPWGNQFDTAKANTNLSRIDKTTPVDHYPNGKSWVNAYDMAGNVSQWVRIRDICPGHAEPACHRLACQCLSDHARRLVALRTIQCTIRKPGSGEAGSA